MNALVKITTIVLLATPIVAAAAEAEQKLKCSEMLYSIEFLDNYPRSPAACQDVVVRGGQKFARFLAEVTGVKKKGTEVTVSFKNAVGDSLGRVTFAIPAGAQVTIQGQKVKYSSLTKGQKLDVWIPESRMGFFAEPGAAELPIIKREAA